MRERAKSPRDRGLVTQRQIPSLVPAERDLPKPMIQMEKEEKTPKTKVSSEICPVGICSS